MPPRWRVYVNSSTRRHSSLSRRLLNLLNGKRVYINYSPGRDSSQSKRPS